MYKVNNFEDQMIPSMDPEVLKKKIKEATQWTKEIEFADRHLDHLEELSRNKKCIMINTEAKECESARHNSILAAHFQRLKKYYSKDEMRKIQGKFNLDDMEFGQNLEITYPGTKGFSNNAKQFRCNQRKYKEKPKIPKVKGNESIWEKSQRLKIEKLHMPYGVKA